MKDLIECYTHIETPREPKVFTIEEYAYKVCPLKYLIERESHALEFANEYAIL